MRLSASLSLIVSTLLISSTLASGLTDDRKIELRNLVLQDCGSCHGMTMKGGLGSALTPAKLDDADVAALASIILDGVPGKPMPPWRGLINENEAKWIAEALKNGQIR